MASLTACSRGGQGGRALWGLRGRGANSVTRAPSARPSPNTVHWELEFQRMGFGDKHLRSVALCVLRMFEVVQAVERK